MSKKKNKHKRRNTQRKPGSQPRAAQSAAVAPLPVAAVAAGDLATDAAATEVPAAQALAASKPATKPVPAAARLGKLDASNRWLYVRGDIRRIGVLASACIVIELVLWYVLSYTALGTQLYNWVKF